MLFYIVPARKQKFNIHLSSLVIYQRMINFAFKFKDGRFFRKTITELYFEFESSIFVDSFPNKEYAMPIDGTWIWYSINT